MPSFLNQLLGAAMLLSAVAAPLQAQTTLNLMPVPAALIQHDGQLRLDPHFTVAFRGHADPRLYPYATRFLRRLDGRTGLFLSQVNLSAQDDDPHATLLIDTAAPGRLGLGANESYRLVIGPAQIKLTAPTDLGALRGLETLLQLLASDRAGYYLPQLTIDDRPRFPWRGLMLDVARHFLPLDVVERNIDGMAAVKLNVLHLHLTDNQGFRIESKTFPKLTGMGSDGQYFSQQQVRDIVAYADARGIRVVPEFDLPAHATAMLVGYPELGSRPGPYQLERRFGIFSPVLDPSRDQTYAFLDQLLAELLPLFPDQYVHIGGDENAEGKDWRENPAIQAFMKQHQLADNHALQAYFNQRLLKILSRQQRKMIGWEEIMHPSMPKDALIQIWLGQPALADAATKGYDTLLSFGYYIDLMEPVEKHYLNDPLPPQSALTAAQRQHVLGGEATMWSELVTAQNVDSRIWPRMAAIAERLWSPPEVRNVDDMQRRLDVTSTRLEELGLTHLTSRAAITRNLAGASADTAPLDALLDVVAPQSGYTRNAHDTTYSVTSPFTLFADAANTDPRGARLFQRAMQRFLADGNAQDGATLRSMLTLWKNNHAGIAALILRSPMLKDIEAMSANLQAISELGLGLLDGPAGISAQQYRDAPALLQAARQQGGRTTLQVVTPIEQLLALRLRQRGATPTMEK